MPLRRLKRYRRLDLLCLGASPEKLKKHEEIPAIAVPAPLSDPERIRLSELTTKRLLVGPLTREEAYEREQLRKRHIAEDDNARR